jgi:hypothetical protein
MWSKPSTFGYRTVDADVFPSGIQALASRWDICLHVTSEYVQSDVHFWLPTRFFIYRGQNNELGVREFVTLLYETSFRVTIGKFREISLKFSGMKYNENPSSCFRVVAFVHVRMDKRKDRAILMGVL